MGLGSRPPPSHSTRLAVLKTILLTATFLLVCATQGFCQQTVLSDETVKFVPLNVDYPVSLMEMSDEGDWLYLSHTGDNMVSVYDVAAGQIESTFDTPSPRSVLARGNTVAVANEVAGNIHVFVRRGAEWNATKVIPLPKKGIKYMSAPRGKAFRNFVFVTCHGEGGSASYQDTVNYVVNLNSGAFQQFLEASLVTASHDGQFLLTQQSFNLSPGGGISVYSGQNLLQAGRNARKLFGGGTSSTPFIYQVNAGGYWMGGNMVFGGTPLMPIGDELGELVIPDVSQKLVYALNGDMITAHALKGTVQSLTGRRAEFPQDFREADDLFNRWRSRSYRLDHPFAKTIGNELHLFMRPAGASVVLTARTKAFVPTSTPSVREKPTASTPKRPAKSIAVAERTWTSAKGQFSVRAKLVGVKDGNVQLLREDGKELSVPLDKLSVKDREFVQEWQETEIEENPFE